MKQLFTALTLISGILAQNAFAQIGCGNGRYESEIFTTVTKTADIQYGSNPNGEPSLTLDFYEPAGDTMAMRPLIIWAHGGSFVGGTKNDGDIVTFCNRFAKMGYATASINYTLGFDQLPPNPESAARTVYRTVHEMKAAIRYFRKDAATTNTYRINPDVVIVGGSSAGAFIALHTAYLDQYSELPAGIDTTGLNGLEGICGNPGYNSTPQIVVNLCGAIGDTAWMRNNTQPLVSMHGDQDGTVPYGSATILFLGAFPVMPVDGSSVIAIQADNLGILSAFHPWYGQDHVPYVSSQVYMDSTVTFVKDFLASTICAPTFSVENQSENNIQVSVFPNPASEYINVSCHGITPQRFELMDMNGRIVLSNKIQNESQFGIGTGNLANGVYFLRLRSNNQTATRLVQIQH
jgi:hypothetical protein